MPDLIHITSGSAQKRWPEAERMILAYRLASGLDLFGQNWNCQPEANWIRAGFVQQILGCLWKNATEPESEKLVPGWLHSARNQAWGFLHTSLLQDKMHLLKTWPSHPDWTRISFAHYRLWSSPSLEKWNQTECSKSDTAWIILSDSGCKLAITDCNQSTSDWIRHVHWDGISRNNAAFDLCYRNFLIKHFLIQFICRSQNISINIHWHSHIILLFF